MACPCWRQPAHFGKVEDARVVINSVCCTVSVPFQQTKNSETKTENRCKVKGLDTITGGIANVRHHFSPPMSQPTTCNFSHYSYRELWLDALPNTISDLTRVKLGLTVPSSCANSTEHYSQVLYASATSTRKTIWPSHRPVKSPANEAHSENYYK